MILETIVTTASPDGTPHIAPMGVQATDEGFLIMPFRPSTTLDNLVATRCAVINATDDVRVFAGCLTGRRDWPLAAAERVACVRLSGALSHTEVELTRIEEDPLRPKLFCRMLASVNHHPFRGFNRAQFSVIEAAILVSRLRLLPEDKIQRELSYLEQGIDKTAGPHELEAWSWLMAAVADCRRNRSRHGESA